MSKKKSKTIVPENNGPQTTQIHEVESGGGAVAVATLPESDGGETGGTQEAAELSATKVEVESQERKPKSVAKTKKSKTKSAVTLSDVAKGYIQQLEENAAGPGTLMSYEMELVSAMAELGAEKPVADLTLEEVAAFFECPRVIHTKKGGLKSPLTVAKTRRVFRQALVWAVGAGLIESAPLPYDLRKE